MLRGCSAHWARGSAFLTPCRDNLNAQLRKWLSSIRRWLLCIGVFEVRSRVKRCRHLPKGGRNLG